ncbi:MAG: hypothetical protein GWN00_22415 [Aliifodinibius sp.]|nr:YceI family protein [candidate division Zixibacteria bacterium]NIT58874.1 YceI family protein [Fodinibius sp.]NIW39862.1 hypothetical protein [candidate division Zixibacteria bacterium]NIX57589.1 hypothetical protein [candidate division Zixibacteria bacterium]NIY27457.1 hypothetical protein [Fodinibius sp.]
MRKAFLLALFLMIGTAALLLAQEGEMPEEQVIPETTTFYFGQGLENDVLMLRSLAIFDNRAPLGSAVGLVRGMTGELTIWLDSIKLVEVEEVVSEEEEEIQEPDTMAEADTAAEMPAEEEPAAAEEAEEQADTVRLAPAPTVVPPSGYTQPVMVMEIPLNRLTTGNPQLDEMLKSEDYFNVSEYPTATFVLTNVTDPSEYRLQDMREISLIASGELTLNGLSKRYANINVFITYIEEKPITGENTGMTGDLIHIIAEFTISLSDFAISIEPENLVTLDDKVNIMFDGFGSTNRMSASAPAETGSE